MNKITRSYFELLVGTLCWGFGFIAALYALAAVSPFWLTCFRFLIAAVVLDLLFRFKLFGFKPHRYSWAEIKATFLSGLALFILLSSQNWGLKTTSATRSSFITVLYVLFIPIFEFIFLSVRVRKILALWIMLALVGTAFICKAITAQGIGSDFLSAFHIGDFLTLICAAAAAAHFIFVNEALPKVPSPIKFNILQCAWVAVIGAIFGSLFEGFSWWHTLLAGEWTAQVWIGVIHLGLFSSALAFLCQIRAQQFISPSSIGIFVLLESPFAMLFSILLLHEALTWTQVLGAGLVLSAAVGESLCQMRAERETMKLNGPVEYTP
jgi:drug/metabolite transporter (DMT)-like permease